MRCSDKARSHPRRTSISNPSTSTFIPATVRSLIIALYAAAESESAESLRLDRKTVRKYLAPAEGLAPGRAGGERGAVARAGCGMVPGAGRCQAAAGDLAGDQHHEYITGPWSPMAAWTRSRAWCSRLLKAAWLTPAISAASYVDSPSTSCNTIAVRRQLGEGAAQGQAQPALASRVLSSGRAAGFSQPDPGRRSSPAPVARQPVKTLDRVHQARITRTPHPQSALSRA